MGMVGDLLRDWGFKSDYNETCAHEWHAQYGGEYRVCCKCDSYERKTRASGAAEHTIYKWQPRPWLWSKAPWSV